MMKREKSVGAVIFRKNRAVRYLLLHYESGHWDYVKGHVEKGETEKDTLLREAKEETGLKDIRIIDGFKKEIHYFHKRGNDLISKYAVFYLAETKTPKIKLSFEHTGYKWLNYKDAVKQLTYQNAKDVLKSANGHLKKRKNSELKSIKAKSNKKAIKKDEK